ncbi:hypothetical protein D3C78_1237200 [compost metagenome]
MSGMASSEKSFGRACGISACRMSSRLNCPRRKPSTACRIDAGPRLQSRLATEPFRPMSSSVYSRISRPVMPAAMPAPMMEPMEEPEIATGRMPSSSSASMTLMWQMPRAPPPPSASPNVGSWPPVLSPWRTSSPARTIVTLSFTPCSMRTPKFFPRQRLCLFGKEDKTVA